MNDVQPCIDYWKPRLGLSDWQISCKIVPYCETNNDATSHIRFNAQRVTIKLSDPNTFPSNRDPADPLELTLLHELVHVRLWSIDPETVEGVEHHIKEQSIEWLARALYGERYKV